MKGDAMKVFIANNPQALENLNPSHTVEAEYGDTVVEGTVLTLAHHGPRSNNPAPCIAEVPVLEDADAVIGCSHLDLDTIGGVAAILGRKPENDTFWAAAAQVDVSGPHRVDEILMELNAGDSVKYQLHAYWAWAEAHKVFPPRDGSALDVTEQVFESISVLERILAGDPELLRAGKAWFDAKEALAEASFDCTYGSVLVRKSDQFVNHLYNHGGRTYRAVVALNTKFNSVTISLESPVEGVSCCEVVQALWGPEAGGHAGIAGSPRGAEFGESELNAATIALNKALA
jgi:hypothetical protein